MNPHRFVFKGYGIYHEVDLEQGDAIKNRYKLKSGEILTRPQVDNILNDLILIVCGADEYSANFHYHAIHLLSQLDKYTRETGVNLLDEGVDWYYEYRL